MKVLSGLSLLIFYGLQSEERRKKESMDSSVFGENEVEKSLDEVNIFFPEHCVRMCCPFGEYFNSTSNQCQAIVTEPVESEIGGGNFSICPGGTWRDVEEKFKFLVEYECAGLVTDGSKLIQNALLCPEIPVTKWSRWNYSFHSDLFNVEKQNCSLKSYDQSVDLAPVQSATNNLTVNISTKVQHFSAFLRLQTTWLRDDEEKFNALREYECVEHVTDGSKLIRKALLCPKIPLTFCCDFHMYYGIDSLLCYWWYTNESVGLLPVYSKTNNLTVRVSANEFQVTVDLIQCPNGYYSQISPDFTLFDDGTVKIAKITSKFSPEQACIAKVRPETDFVALFCVPDPCTASSCLRKSCPKGHRWNVQWVACERTDIEFSVDYRNETGQKAPLPRNMPIRSGFVPCEHDRIENILEGDFYIQPNGAMYVPAFPEGHRVFDDYCVDDFNIDGDNEIVSIFIS